MGTLNPGRRALPGRILAALGLLGCVACTQPRVTEVQHGGVGRLPRPDRILVRDFAVAPQDVRLDQGLRGRLTQTFSPDSTGERQLEAARSTAAALADAMATELRKTGLPVERTSRAELAGPGRFVVVDGHVLSVDEGNRTRRTLIGLGRGMSSVEVSAQMYFVEPGTPPRLIESFTAHADSGYAPGMAETMGIGAAAGRATTAAAVGGLGHVAIEGSRADDAAEARRIGTGVAKRIELIFVQRGWATPRP